MGLPHNVRSIPPFAALALTFAWPTRPCTTLLCPTLPRPAPAGLPESVSKTRQALARGYAVASVSSADRSTGVGGRCWKWADDAAAVAEAVAALPRLLRLPRHTKVFLDGASSGGSLALRLPQVARVDGVVGGGCMGRGACVSGVRGRMSGFGRGS